MLERSQKLKREVGRTKLCPLRPILVTNAKLRLSATTNVSFRSLHADDTHFASLHLFILRNLALQAALKADHPWHEESQHIGAFEEQRRYCSKPSPSPHASRCARSALFTLTSGTIRCQKDESCTYRRFILLSKLLRCQNCRQFKQAVAKACEHS